MEKKKIKTKEELVAELAVLKQEIESRNENNKALRKEFARAFGWNKPRKQYDYGDPEIYDPTWTEIFVELGKILANKDFRNLEENVRNFDFQLREVHRLVKGKDTPLQD
jgi:hypothetical protein